MVAPVVLAALACCPGRGLDAADDVPELDTWIDRAWVEGAFATPPLDVYADPRAASALAEVRLQLDRFTRLALHLPLADAVAATRYLRLQIFRTGPGESVRANMVVGAGAAAEHWCDWFELQNNDQHPKPATCGPCTGVISARGDFIGTHGGDFVIGESAHVPVIAASPVLAPAPAPLVVRCSGAVVATMLASDAAMPPNIAALASALLPVPASAAPMLEAEMDPGGGWTSSIAVRGIGASALRPLSARLGAAVRPGEQLTVALGADPSWLGKLLAGCFSASMPYDAVQALSAHTTGEALLQGQLDASPGPLRRPGPAGR